MVCTQVTITTAKPVISNVSATVDNTTQGQILLTWYQDRAGAITVYVDVTLIGNPAQVWPSGQNSLIITGLSVGTHNVCVTAT